MISHEARPGTVPIRSLNGRRGSQWRPVRVLRLQILVE